MPVTAGVGAQWGGEVLDYVPDTAIQEQVEPICETWPGWQTDTSQARAWDDLPELARAYVNRVGRRSHPFRLGGARA